MAGGDVMTSSTMLAQVDDCLAMRRELGIDVETPDLLTCPS